ncbi:MAG: metallophosphoesterase [Eubacteriales bacterium]|nr:metallophosphoesterase [Eubacteriales bacterium]
MKRMSNRRAALLYSALATLLLLVGVTIWTSMYCMSVTEYEYNSPKLMKEIRVLQLSDLHDNAWLLENDRLLQEARRLQPDVIVLTGDMLNYYTVSEEPLLRLMRGLTDIAPTFYSFGNHEIYYRREHEATSLFQKLTEAGITVLADQYKDIQVNGQAVRIGGLYDYTYNIRQLNDEDYRNTDTYIFLASYEDTDAFKLLLCHKPEFLLAEEHAPNWDIDLALCGHEHGGQVRLPLLGGFYSTHLGWFSPYLDGAQLINGIPTVISRGLGTYLWSSRGFPIPFRFCNTPELSLITLQGV